ncbi:ImmA/IrrE family metallo-endopeptidase [Rhizobium sp. LCM 4573]|uniref:ImmA/IrrE family metallo-endopeptidase n=1 Tax=Rhizobium sp. LCM 4573 TaxID=1848291 RepID=UPI0008D9F045|nr:ImmA/IrrE family metallo-endopeptidase [Rhizobium sp. LCM 4573]OHV82597.1 hypothetical protein LCM4573_16485 [Rhizobium sp. LCM 4573]
MLVTDKVIDDLGITEPHEIDIEAIAWHLGAKVKYCQVDGCEACILGANDRAIIRVSDKVLRPRQRFSIGHELGHWCHHRRRALYCKPEDIGSLAPGKPTPKRAEEKVADNYASNLLMPWKVFRPVTRQYKDLTFDTVAQVASAFETSLTATAIRLIDMDHTPALLVSHGPNGRRWFARSKSVPERWFPRDELQRESPSFDVLFGKAPESKIARKVDADSWFDRYDADRYQITEQTRRAPDGSILTLLVIKDERMLRDEETRGWSGRRY